MRKTRNAQASIFDFQLEHESGALPCALSELLDEYPYFLRLGETDLPDPQTMPGCALTVP